MLQVVLPIVLMIAFIIFAPFVGCLISGLDRIITARMQGRVGPPILQPWYDVRKLFAKEDASTNPSEYVYIIMFLAFVIVAGAIFCAGGNFLLVVFVLTLGELFFILAAFTARSPYSDVGAMREILQVMAYEPMVLLVGVGLYMVTGSFDTASVSLLGLPLIAFLPALFLGFLFVLTIKLRKSPFDLSMSHHAHQELVRGITTEMSGRTLAVVEIAHWYETVLYLCWVALFLIWGSWISVIVALVVCVVVYLLEIFIDNNFARVKWQLALKSSWWLAFILGALNLAVLPLLGYFIG